MATNVDTLITADDLAGALVDELVLSPLPDWSAVHDAAEKLTEIAARELRIQRRDED
jgi:hypothetical protein